MNFDQQRIAALRLAKEAGASKTHEAIKDTGACYETILKTAAAEGGIDKLVEAVLQGDPWWAYKMLTVFPDLGDERGDLIKKAAEDPQSAIHTYRFIDNLEDGQQGLLQNAASGLVAPVAAIFGFELDQNGSYTAYYAMKWINNGTMYPGTGVWGAGWGIEGGYENGQYHKLNCADYAQLMKMPLSVGDTVWPCMWAEGGDGAESPVQFTYQEFLNPNKTRAQFESTGTIRSVNFDYKGTFDV